MHYPIQDGDRVVKESHVMMCPEELLLFIKMQKKKHYINIAFQNFKIKCARNETELTFQNC